MTLYYLRSWTLREMGTYICKELWNERETKAAHAGRVD